MSILKLTKVLDYLKGKMIKNLRILSKNMLTPKAVKFLVNNFNNMKSSIRINLFN